MASLSLAVPSEFDLARDYCSYGYFLLWPNHWDPRTRVMSRAATLPGGPTLLRVDQPGGPGTALRVRVGRTLTREDRAEIRRQLSRMLRLDEPAELIRTFHAVDPRWAESGRGRLMRSPTFFEDVIKTVTSCNVTWPGTLQMNRRLCEVLGDEVPEARGGGPMPPVTHTFPTPARLARARASTLRARCRVGYRDARIIALAKMFASKRTLPLMESLERSAAGDKELFDDLVDLPGIGPYAAANIMQLLGRYGRLPLDSESVRHGRSVLGFKGNSAAVMKRVHVHFAPFGPHAFRAYWFELWEHYERRHGPSWTWERDSTGKLFTASALNKAEPRPPEGSPRLIEDKRARNR